MLLVSISANQFRPDTRQHVLSQCVACSKRLSQASFMPDVQRAHSLEVLEAKVQDCRLHYLERRFTITLPRMSQEEAQKERTAKEKFLMSDAKSCSALG